MAGSVNKVILIGNLGRDPEARRTNSGNKVVSFRMATSETWKDKATGERKEKTEWHSVVIFNEHIAEVAEHYCKKGSKVYVEGKLRTRKWEKDGADHYTTEVVLEQFRGELTLLDGAQRHAPSEDEYGTTRTRDDYSAAKNGSVQSGGSLPTSGSRFNDLDDDIPF